MIKVKVCGMCDPSNVKELAEAKPDFMGFIFYHGSPRYVGMSPDRALFINVPASIPRIGVFVNEDTKKILDLSLSTGIEMIQLHGTESPVYCLQLKSAGLTLIKVFSFSESFDFEILKPYMPVCDYFLFDTKTDSFGGSGKKFNWDKLSGYDMDKPFFLSGGIGSEDTELIKTLENRGFYAVDVNSCFETVPGIKNVPLLRTFINEIKT